MKTNLIKKIARPLIAAALLLCLCASAMAATVTTTDQVFLRTKASLKGGIVKEMQKGTQLKYAGYTRKDADGNVWYAVKYKGQRVGYVAAKYAKLFEDKADKQKTNMVIADAGSAKIRDLPSLEGAPVSVLKKGHRTPCLQIKKDAAGNRWFKVSYHGKDGWVSEKYASVGKV